MILGSFYVTIQLYSLSQEDSNPSINTSKAKTKLLSPKKKRVVRNVFSVKKEKSLVSGVVRRDSCSCVFCETDEKCGGLWHGKAVINNKSNSNKFNVHNSFEKISLVVSHCLNELSWLNSFISGVESSIVMVIVIISKCNTEVEGAPLGSTILKLPNVGGCDHSYIHYINKIYDSDNSSREAVVFLKDHHDPNKLKKDEHFNSLLEILNNIYVKNFCCGFEPKPLESVYHTKALLKNFKMENYTRTKGFRYSDIDSTKSYEFKSNFSNLRDYMKTMDYEFPKPSVTEVCYGGYFGTSRQAIHKKSSKFWHDLEKSLSRGNNIEEGHFMERSWAGILADPVSTQQSLALTKHSDNSWRAKDGELVSKTLYLKHEKHQIIA